MAPLFEGHSRMNVEKEQKTDVFVVSKDYKFSIVRCQSYVSSSKWDNPFFYPSS